MERTATTSSLDTTTIRTTRARTDRRARGALQGAIAAIVMIATASLGAALAATSDGSRRAESGTLSANRFPLQFEANAGQTDGRVAFLARGPGYTLFLSPGQSDLLMTDANGRGASVRMTLLGASPEARLAGEGAPSGRVNYYIGSDASRWRSGIPAHARVRASGVYPGIDLVYYGVGRTLEYDFVVAPGADTSAIRLQIDGADRVRIQEDGSLGIAISGREIRWGKPVVYQKDGGGARIPVDGRYVKLGRHRIGFRVGAHDARRPLVIDPTLDYATYLGGTDLTVSAEQAQGVAADAAGNAAVAGITTTTLFPVTPGAFQSTRKGSGNFTEDCFVAKFNASGSALTFATYMGGTVNDQGGSWKMGVAIASNGEVLVAGHTNSTDFPTTAGSFRPDSVGGGDAWVARFNVTGGLVWSSYLGGTAEDRSFCLDLDGSGNVYVGGETNSANFPFTPGAFHTGGGAFITKITPDGSAIVWATSFDTAFAKVHGCVVDAGGAVYATGMSGNQFSMTATPGVFLPTYDETFVAKLHPDGASVDYLTWFGADDVWDIAVNAQGEVVVAGDSMGSFTATPGAYQTTYGGSPNPDVVVAKINADATQMTWGTYLGKSAGDNARGVGFDDQGRVWVAGNTFSQNFPTTAGALQASWRAGWIGSPFLALLSADGSSLEYGSFVNDNQWSVMYDFTTDASGRAYLVGQAGTGFPTTTGAYRTSVGGNSDIFLARFGTGGGGGPDGDGDGVPDAQDNCPAVANANQTDTDSDGHGDVCDNCPQVANPSQTDTDADGTGDACETGADSDGDGVLDVNDNCPTTSNANQTDTDADGHGNVCDNCPNVSNPGQEDSDSDGTGDACDGPADADGDGVSDATDNCPATPNADQADGDDDGAGDACDVTVISPLAGAVLDCSDPTHLRPTISWGAGPYDKFKVFIGRDPAFSTGTVNSGDTWVTATSWSPSGKKWKKACGWAGALPTALGTEGGALYIRIQGLDKNVSKRDPLRKVYSTAVQVSASAAP